MPPSEVLVAPGARRAPRASVVIPAHDEERVLAACLAPLAAGAADGSLDVVVVANGCSDATAAVAAAHDGVSVVELGAASKAAALNAGDAAAAAWPRLHLDADVVLSPGAVDALVDALSTPEPVVGSVAVSFATLGRPWPVRAFYRVYEQTPYVASGLVGLGLYGFSAAGRARFGEFPDLVADDLFVQRLFAPHERRVLGGHHVRVQTPRTTAALLAVRTRTATGNAQLADVAPQVGGRTSGSTARALLRLLARPARWGDVAVYVAITAASRWRARRAVGGTWERDGTTR